MKPTGTWHIGYRHGHTKVPRGYNDANPAPGDDVTVSHAQCNGRWLKWTVVMARCFEDEPSIGVLTCLDLVQFLEWKHGMVAEFVICLKTMREK